jgi:hypothetical protein
MILGKWRTWVMEEGVGGFLKNGIVYKCSPNQLIPMQPHYPVWDGLSLKFIYFIAGSLTTI